MVQDARAGTSIDTKLGDQMYTELSNKGASNDLLQQGFISTIVGPNTWGVIQSGVNQDKRLGQINDMSDTDFTKMAEFFRAYDQGHVLPKGMDGVFSGSANAPKSLDDIVSTLKQAKVSTFKNNLGVILNSPEFVKNTVKKLYEKDPEKVNRFSTVYDIRKRDESNMSALINKEVQQGLGDYAALFPSDTGKFIVNESTINKAWEKLPANKKVAYGVIDETGLNNVQKLQIQQGNRMPTIRYVPLEEFIQITGEQPNATSLQKSLSFDDFKETIEDKTKKSLVKFHRTNLGKVETRGFEAKEIQAKAELATLLTQSAVLSTDNKEDAAKIASYINSHMEDIVGMETYTPTIGSLPQIKVKIKVPDAKDGDNSHALALKANEFMFDVASSSIPQKYTEKSNPTRSLTIRNAKILRTEIPGGGTFELVNDGTNGKLQPVPQFRDDSGNVIPYITVIDPTSNKPLIVTHEDIMQKLELNSTNLDKLITNNTELQARLSSLMNSWKAYYK